MAKKQHVQPPCQWLMAQNALIVESVVAENAFHFAKLKTYKYVASTITKQSTFTLQFQGSGISEQQLFWNFQFKGYYKQSCIPYIIISQAALYNLCNSYIKQSCVAYDRYHDKQVALIYHY